jgi:hypothetical protein
MIQVRIGSRQYDAVKVSNCRTCTHPARMHIEEKILLGFAYREIEEQFSEREMVLDKDSDPQWLPRVGRESIRNHYVVGHMPMEAATMRRIAERRAHTVSRSVQDGDVLVDQYVLAEAVVARTHQRLALGEIEPEVRDGLAAAKFLQSVQAEIDPDTTAEAWTQAMTVYFETARRVMPLGMWAQFTQELSGNPILRAIQQRLTEPDDAIDVEYDVHGDT